MGLVDDYGSGSDSDEEQQPVAAAKAAIGKEESSTPSLDLHDAPPKESNPPPVLGPARPPQSLSPDLELEEGDGTPLSPYSTERAQLRSLTLPTIIPDIPPSPPGSPDAAAVKKFAHFRDLKAQGLHFNEKLLRSSTLRNPNLLEKLTAFVGFEKDDEYATNLSPAVWDPTSLPKEGFKDALAKKQVEVAQRREKERRETGRVEFVGGVAEKSEAVDRGQSGTPAKSERRKTRFDKQTRDESPRELERTQKPEDERERRRDGGRDRRDYRKRSRSRSAGRDREGGGGRDSKRHKDLQYRDRR